MNVIEVKDLSVDYGPVRALDNINLQVEKGEFLGIIGPNGGGKTTLLKVLLGLIKPNHGEVEINFKKPIGYVPQFSHFDREFPISVLDVILLGALEGKIKILHKFKKDQVKKAEEIMKSLGILEFKDRQISQLSGGQLQKVLIARALMVEPEVMILDEPTASLDANSKTEIYNLLKLLNKDKTILVVSHDMGVINSYIDTVACLNRNLHYHGDDTKLDQNVLEKVYGCPVELVAHGPTPHRVLKIHEEDEK
ncbi:metal ABC transporter ATP-binding protein [Clostridium sp. D2Q-11]|uniref:Metal ABC transporter ATP-binding protein n=1 Tax=Anaeromonas frigoriresistens TaxID=2683708 RepID=A0A942Z8B0_9FIRM|nr:metal ABC transporter ATP-binding protein [Anaeromonas frigoriresistens]MBS4538103.1 metal ABC transporter ATP-binding protein [Anaeromonas frigoriresistens]